MDTIINNMKNKKSTGPANINLDLTEHGGTSFSVGNKIIK